MPELGSRVERHETSNRRRAVKAAIAIVLAIPLLAVGAFSLMIVFSRSSSGVFVPAVIAGCGLGLLLLGVILAVQSVWRRGEEFTVYENGFVHSYGNRTLEVPWGDIVTITDIGRINEVFRNREALDH